MKTWLDFWRMKLNNYLKFFGKKCIATLFFLFTFLKIIIALIATVHKPFCFCYFSSAFSLSFVLFVFGERCKVFTLLLRGFRWMLHVFYVGFKFMDLDHQFEQLMDFNTWYVSEMWFFKAVALKRHMLWNFWMKNLEN